MAVYKLKSITEILMDELQPVVLEGLDFKNKENSSIFETAENFGLSNFSCEERNALNDI